MRGAPKDAPVIGLAILSGLKKEGTEYTGGQILDPDNGKIYSSKIQVTDGGKKLNVRGYIGAPMLGRARNKRPSSAGTCRCSPARTEIGRPRSPP